MNMKKFIYLLIINLSVISLVSAQSYSPRISSQVDKNLNIVSIERTSANTIVRFEYKRTVPNEIYIFLHSPDNKNAYFIQANGVKYNLLMTEGIANKDGITLAPPFKTMKFSAFFKPIPTSIVRFDLIEGVDGQRNFYGVELLSEDITSIVSPIKKNKSENISNPKTTEFQASNSDYSTSNTPKEEPISEYLIMPVEGEIMSKTSLLSDVIAKVQAGELVGFYSIESGYYKVNYKGRIGYIDDRCFKQISSSNTSISSNSVAKEPYKSLNPKNEEEKILDSWLNSKKEDLIKANGPPDAVSSDGKGGEIYSYGITQRTVLSPGISTNYHSDNPYVFEKDVTFYDPAITKITTRSRMFFINEDGIIYYWLIKSK